jgi:hypothetical protein
MAYIPPNPNGLNIMSNSTPVVIAQDQATVNTAVSHLTGTSGNWSTSTTVNTALTITTTLSFNSNVASASSVTVTMSNTSTMTAGALAFEVSNDSGTSWFAVSMSRIDSYTSESSYTLNTVANRAWKVSVNGFDKFRVRLSTAITGTGIATIKITANGNPTDSLVTVGQATAANLQTTAAVSSIAAGSNLIGKVNLSAQTAGGATSFTLISAATTNATNLKTSAGTLYMLTATNNSSTVAFLKLYNKASAPTVGTDTPVMTFMLPANGGIAVPIPAVGINFATGIGYALTGAATTADTTAVALNQIQLNGAYL